MKPTQHGCATPTPTSFDPTTLTVDRRGAAHLLGISERLLWTWTNAGRIPHVRIGARVLYPIDALRRWLEERTR